MSNEVDFIHESLPETDIGLFFFTKDITPSEEEKKKVVRFDDTWTIAHFLVHVGVFPSLTVARKNGGDGKLLLGWNEIQRGKGPRMKKLFILNKFDPGPETQD